MTTTANAATKVDDSHIQVEQGDTLSEIAHDNGIDLDQLASMNNIANKNLIHVGDKLVITPQAKNTQDQSINTQVQTSAIAQPQATSQAPAQQTSAPATSNVSGGSVHDQFIAAGGTEAMWNTIVIPESGGNPNATNGQYRGLGQTNQSWGTGSVAEQTRGMINYANSRYGSIQNALNFRSANNYW